MARNVYHVTIGSENDPVSFTVSVMADSKAEAVRILRDQLPCNGALDPGDWSSDAIRWVECYFRPELIRESDIGEEHSKSDRARLAALMTA